MIKLMLKYLHRRQWELLVGSVIVIAAQVYFSLKIYDYMATITKLVKTQGSSFDAIIQNGIWMLVCAVASAVAAIAADYTTTKLASMFSSQLRQAMYQKVESFSLGEIDGFSTASLITRSTNDVTQIQNFMSRGLRMLISMPFTAGWALFKISTRYWQWTAMTAATVALVSCVVIFMIIYAHPRLRRRQQMTDDLSRTLRENLTGIRVIRAYNAEQYQQAKFEQANDVLTDNEIKAHHAMSLMRPSIKFANNFLTVGIYVIGAYLIANTVGSEQLDIFSDMVVFSSYAAKLLQSFMNLNMVFNQYPRAAVSAERIQQVLSTKPTIIDGPAAEVAKGGRLEFKNVSFRYPNTSTDTLHDISFTAAPGQTVAFIGATGCGKTSLVQLIPRLYDCNGGQVLLNGVDIREYSQQALRNLIGFATQRAVLFSGTVKSNVAYGDNGAAKPDEKDVTDSIDIAQVTEFVSQMKQGIDSFVARGGSNLSGGQKQRLSIARAVCRKPEIYIFDDSFSALDYKTDRQLRNQLKTKTAGVTTILVAQRIGTIRDADKIIVLDDGAIVGQGTHQQLLKECRLYQQIAQTQLSQEELA